MCRRATVGSPLRPFLRPRGGSDPGKSLAPVDLPDSDGRTSPGASGVTKTVSRKSTHGLFQAKSGPWSWRSLAKPAIPLTCSARLRAAAKPAWHRLFGSRRPRSPAAVGPLLWPGCAEETSLRHSPASPLPPSTVPTTGSHWIRQGWVATVRRSAKDDRLGGPYPPADSRGLPP